MDLRLKLNVLAPAVGLAPAASMLVATPPASAAGASCLELPCTCGTSWAGKSGASSAHHNEIDWNLSSGAEDRGKPVLVAAAGTARWGASGLLERITSMYLHAFCKILRIPIDCVWSARPSLPIMRAYVCFGQCGRGRDDLVAVAHGGDCANLSA